MELTERLQVLINASSNTGTAAVRDAEGAILAAASSRAPHDAEHQSTLLGLLKAVDQGFEAFQQHPTMQDAYKKLSAATPEVFWDKGFAKLKALRDKIWATV